MALVISKCFYLNLNLQTTELETEKSKKDRIVFNAKRKIQKLQEENSTLKKTIAEESTELPAKRPAKQTTSSPGKGKSTFDILIFLVHNILS